MLLLDASKPMRQKPGAIIYRKTQESRMATFHSHFQPFPFPAIPISGFMNGGRADKHLAPDRFGRRRAVVTTTHPRRRDFTFDSESPLSADVCRSPPQSLLRPPKKHAITIAVRTARPEAAPTAQTGWRTPRRGAGAVDRGGLENRCTRKGTEGSNPSLSASIHEEIAL